MNTPPEWHARFQQQAAWTAQLRRYLLDSLRLEPSARILEVGCGTGVITAETLNYTNCRGYGLDIQLPFLRLAQQHDPRTRFTAGDALRLPYAPGSFDAVACHFFLLWMPDPASAIAEMVRVTRPDGAVMAFAEPDYGGRIDYPEALVEAGALQARSLHQQGADPNMGRKLSGLFHAASLVEIETGVLGGQWQGASTPVEIESEWATLETDLRGMLAEEQLHSLRAAETAARQSGQRVLFVPTFYARGKKRQSFSGR